MKNKLVIKKDSKNALAPNVVGGGIAIPIGNNMYYMKGRKHEQGGIDIGPNNNNGLEVEGEEVVQVKPNELKVFSSVPFLRGNSPAELVLGGANPNTVFNAQERYKDINRLNDDGTKYRNGGDIQYIIDKINNSNKDFAKRLKQSNRKYIKDWEFPNRIATHKLSVGTDENGNNYIYPEVQNINGELHDFTDPKYKHNKWDGQISAEEKGDTIHINTIEDGLNFTSNYKDLDIYPKFKNGGGMNYIINGNVKNSLRHIRPKAKLGDWFRINDTKYNIGDTFNYKGQNYIVNDRNEAIPVSTNLSKANPDAILNAVTAAEWMKNKESFSPNIDLTNKQKSNNTKVNNVAKSVQYTPNPNLVDIPQLNVGNIATYFYTPKTDSTPRKGITTTSSSTNLVKSIPDNTSLSVAYTQPNKISLPRFTEDIYKQPSLSTLAKEIEDVDFIDIPRQSTKPSLKDKIKYRLNNIFGDFTTNDWLDLGTNTASSLISSIASGAILNNMPNVSLPTMTVTQMDALPEITVEELKELEKPATVTAAKLKTRYNINPQLAEIEDTLRRNINEIDRNTADSRVALARKQRASISSQQAKNQLEGQKENIETELINRDRLNQQQVALQNVNAYNQWTQAKAQQALANANLKLAADRANIANKLAVNQYNTTAQNAASQFNATNKIQEILYNSQLDQLKRQGRINNINNVFGNIVGTFSNILTRQEQRNALRRNIELMRTLAPDVPDEKLLSSVVQFLQS